MTDNFNPSLVLVLQSEGGNDDDPNDHGGRTSRGVTQYEYDKYCTAHGQTAGDVWQASDGIISNIYYDEYWLPHCPDLPLGVDYVYFDTGVNAGWQRATRTLQTAIGVKVDGKFGPITLRAAQQADENETITAMSEWRRVFYRSLSQFPRYGHGWLNRVDFCERNALNMLEA